MKAATTVEYVGALSLPVELRYEVCRAIRDSRDIKNHTTLARLASTCSQYSVPALDILWERMEKLGPLLKLLEPALEQQTILDGSSLVTTDRFYTFAQPPRPFDWSRFDLYARRIRSLHTSDQDLDPVIFSKLTEVKMHPLLPRLEQLQWSPRDFSANPALSSLLVPSLRRLAIWNPYPTTYADDGLQPLERLLDTLPSKAPALQALTLSPTGWTMSRASLLFLSRFKFLQTLALQDPIENDVFHTLSALDTLSQVHLCLPSLSLSDDMSRWPRFPCLEELSIDSARLSVLSAIMRHLQTSRLSGFECSTPSKHLEDLHSLCLALSKFTATLTSLSIHFTSRASHSPMSALEPLLQLYKLTNFSLRWSAARMSDADVEKLALAWPQAQTIKITCQGLSIRSLILLAFHCPQLQRLSLTKVNAATGDTLDGNDIPITPRGLQHLDISFIGITDANIPAGVIDRLFPDLETALLEPGEIGNCIVLLQAKRKRLAATSNTADGQQSTTL